MDMEARKSETYPFRIYIKYTKAVVLQKEAAAPSCGDLSHLNLSWMCAAAPKNKKIIIIK